MWPHAIAARSSLCAHGPSTVVGLRTHTVAAVAAVDPDPTARQAAVGPFVTEIDGYRVLVSTLCVLAPLAGLLGTVSGMIVTFDGLATGSMYSRGGGIACVHPVDLVKRRGACRRQPPPKAQGPVAPGR